jgi:DedD protein
MGRAQIVWLTLGGVVAIGITFALGVMVGRRAEKLAAAQHEAPLDPLKRIEEENKLHDQLTFYARLTQPKGATVGSETPLPNKKNKLPDTTKMATDAGEEPTFTAPVAAAPQLPPPSPPPAAADQATDIGKALAKGPAKTGEYTIQVSSFQTNEEANAYAASLKRKGFTPYVVSTQIAGKGTWHRVRLGVFASADDASRAKSELAQNDIPGWVLKSE